MQIYLVAFEKIYQTIQIVLNYNQNTSGCNCILWWYDNGVRILLN